MFDRFIGLVSVSFGLAIALLGCSEADPPSVAVQPSTEQWIDAPIPPPPPVPSPGTPGVAADAAWQSAPIVDPAESPPAVSTELPPGFVEVVPPPMATPEAAKPAEEPEFVEVTPNAPPAAMADEASDEGGAEPVRAATPAIALFMQANQSTVKKLEAVQKTLAAVKDDASAKEAAATLPAETEAFITQSKAATAMYLALSDPEKKLALRQMQLETIRKLQAEGKGNRPDEKNLIELCQAIARGPQRAILHDAIVAMRDVMLDQHSIYVPVRTREEIAKKLGSKGSPLPQ